MEDESEAFREHADAAALADGEDFTLTAVVGRSVATDRMAAANDDRVPGRRVTSHPGRRAADHRFTVPEGMVQRFADGLRSISRKRWS